MAEVLSESKKYLYEQVANKIQQHIEQGILQAGKRLPSVRKLSQQQQVSLSTAFQAYFHLENKGLIESRPRSGFYVRTFSHKLLPEPERSNPALLSTHVNVHELVAKVFDSTRNQHCVPLAMAAPAPELLPLEKLNKALLKATRRDAAESMRYDFPPGYEPLRRQIVRRALEWGGALTMEETITTCGCQEALNLCLRAVAQPGDTIAIESPTYFGILLAIENLGMKALEIITHPRDGICLDTLENALQTQPIKACLIVSNFSNPLGSCMPDAHKQRLVRMLATREIPLIEDDIYGDLYFGTHRPTNAKAYDQQGLVLLCSSFSKTLAPGYRVGWVAAGRYTEQIKRLKYMTSTATSSPPQMAIAEFVENGGYDRHLRHLRAAFSRQVQLTAEAVAKYFPAGTKLTRPLGGCFQWVEMPESVDSLRLHQLALQKQISIAPGPIFSAEAKYRNCIRIGCGHPWSDRIERAVQVLGELAGKE